jgi:hypothetical protein
MQRHSAIPATWQNRKVIHPADAAKFNCLAILSGATPWNIIVSKVSLLASSTQQNFFLIFWHTTLQQQASH